MPLITFGFFAYRLLGGDFLQFQYETQAYHNAPLPTDLNYPDTVMFLSLRALYQQYRAKTISKAQAQVEKKQLERIYKDLQFKQKLYEHSNALYNRINWQGHLFCEDIKQGNDCTKSAKEFYKQVYNGTAPSYFERKVDKDGKI